MLSGAPQHCASRDPELPVDSDCIDNDIKLGPTVGEVKIFASGGGRIFRVEWTNFRVIYLPDI
jgi:hypothetical protein